jgi:hypothetical protein
LAKGGRAATSDERRDILHQSEGQPATGRGPASAVLLDSNLGMRQRPPKWPRTAVPGSAGEPRAERPPASFREVPAIASGERYAGAAGSGSRRTAAQGVSQAGRDDDARPRCLRVRYERAGRSFYSAAAAGGAKMTPAQIAEAQRMAHEWRPKSRADSARLIDLNTGAPRSASIAISEWSPGPKALTEGGCGSL